MFKFLFKSEDQSEEFFPRPTEKNTSDWFEYIIDNHISVNEMLFSSSGLSTVDKYLFTLDDNTYYRVRTVCGYYTILSAIRFKNEIDAMGLKLVLS